MEIENKWFTWKHFLGYRYVFDISPLLCQKIESLLSIFALQSFLKERKKNNRLTPVSPITLITYSPYSPHSPHPLSTTRIFHFGLTQLHSQILNVPAHSAQQHWLQWTVSACIKLSMNFISELRSNILQCSLKSRVACYSGPGGLIS